MRRILAILLPALLVLTACGESGEPEPVSQSAGEVAKLDSVKVTDNGDTTAPGLEFAKPLEVAEPTVKVVSEGSGDAVKAGQVADFAVLAVSGADGSTLQDLFPSDPEFIEMNEATKTNGSLFYNAILGAKVGSFLAFAAPASQGGSSTEAGSTLVIIKITAARDVADGPKGETVTPPAGLPAVTENNGVPEVSVEGVAAPTELISQDLIVGSGPVIRDRSTVTINYVGVTVADGSKVDSSFDKGEPYTSNLKDLIPGWVQGLTGKTVGSRVLLVIPKDLAYGEEKGDLTFVVDILAAN